MRKNVLEVLYHKANFGRAGISPAAGVAETLSFLSVCFSVCLSVTLLNVSGCAPDFAMKALEYRNEFDAIGYGKVCSCAPVLNFLRLLPIVDISKCRSPTKRQKLGVSPPEDDRINRSKRNFAGKRTPWVCYSTSYLALIGKRRSVQERPKVSKFAENCGFWPQGADTMNTFR